MKVSEFLERVQQEIDKEGMPYFEPNELLNRLTTATYFFIEENVPFIQSDQKAKEDFSMLTVPFQIEDKTDDIYKLEDDFYTLVSLRGFFGNTTKPLPIVQSNDLDKLKDDPFHTPTIDYPLCEFFQKGFNVFPTPINVSGLYIKHPIFGKVTTDEIIEGLPINIQLFLIEKVVLHLMTTIGDARYQMQYYQTQNKNTVS